MLSWGSAAVVVDWMHDGVSVGILGPPGGFTQTQAETVAKALVATGPLLGPSALKRAQDACRTASPVRFVNAQATTVGAMHAITGGPPGVHPWHGLFAYAPDNAFAAWCWRKTGDRYQSYAVGPRGDAVFLDVGTDTVPAPGPLPVT